MESKKLKILLVDDNASFRKAVKLFLEKEYNHHIIGEASNGFEFLELIKMTDPDLVLMDIQMPILDGITATKKWCLHNPQTKVIAVTMFTDKIFLQQLIESGFKGCIYKTSFFSEIILAIVKICKGDLYFPKNIQIAK